MSQYENPQVPHEVNVSNESDVKTFFRLSLGIIAIFVVGFILIFGFFRWFADYIPFRYEQSLSSSFFEQDADLEEGQQAALADLQNLADQLVAKSNLPKDMSVQIHLSETLEKNAYTMLGGHITLTQGLIDSVKSENELAMVIGHEIGHVKNRDVIATLGGTFTTGLIVSFLTGSDAGILGQTSGLLTQLSFSRAQEAKADDLALSALKKQYGHTGGAGGFFETILKETDNKELTAEFFNSHPDTKNRLTKIRQTQGKQDPLTPLAKSIATIQNNQNTDTMDSEAEPKIE